MPGTAGELITVLQGVPPESPVYLPGGGKVADAEARGDHVFLVPHDYAEEQRLEEIAALEERLGVLRNPYTTTASTTPEAPDESGNGSAASVQRPGVQRRSVASAPARAIAVCRPRTVPRHQRRGDVPTGFRSARHQRRHASALARHRSG